MAERKGFVSLSRAVAVEALALGPNRLAVWLYIRLNAADREWVKQIEPGVRITIGPMQTLVSQHGIAEATGVHPSSVERALKALRNDGWISILNLYRSGRGRTRGANKGPRLVTVLKDALYVVAEEGAEQPLRTYSLSFGEVGDDARLTGAVAPQRCEKSPSREWKAGYR